jgi:ribosomal protein L40E
MGTFPEAEARLYTNVYVCRKCESKTKVAIGKILAGKGVCRECKSSHLRSVRKRAKK